MSEIQLFQLGKGNVANRDIHESMFRSAIPAPIRLVLGRIRAAYRARRLARLSVSEAFDEIYRKGYWKQGVNLSGVGSEGEWVDSWFLLVKGLVAEHGFKSALDAGCGDFSVGCRVASLFETYTGVDVSEFIIEQNKIKFGSLKGVHFERLNLIEDRVPFADVVLIRQVLQHLTNKQILLILENLQRSGITHALVAEENPIGSFEANLDLESHSVLTRLDKHSGVDLRLAPFSQNSREVASFRTKNANGESSKSLLSVQLIELIKNRGEAS